MSPRRHSPLTIENILLGLLIDIPKHGYELHREILDSKGLATIWRVKPSKLYSLLDKMENAGLLKSKLVPSEKKPGRKVFSITKDGIREFNEWVSAPVEIARHFRLVFHARLYFALPLGKSIAIKLVNDQKEECARWRENLISQLPEAETADFISKQVITYRLSQIDAILGWLNLVEQDIIDMEISN